uniref:Phosphate transporter protein3 n=1 Tax=Zea mays TaxID=4577 RepID=A0A804MIB0_MAIZE
MPLRELAGEETELLAAALQLLYRLLPLLGQVDVEHTRHVGRGLLGVLGDQRGVPRRLGHLHAPVVGEQSRDGAEHEDDAPHVVGLWHRGAGGVVLVRRRVEAGLKRRRDGNGDDAAGEVAEALHGEDGRDECAARPFVGVLGHDGRGQRVVAADADAEPEAEEAERDHDVLGRGPEREAGGEAADGHEHERHPVHLLAAHLVAEPAEEELPGERAAEGDAVDGCGDVGREGAGGLGAGVRVVDAAEELGDEGDGEEVVRIGEEAHAGDHHRREVVPLCLGCVQRVQHLVIVCHFCNDSWLRVTCCSQSYT